MWERLYHLIVKYGKLANTSSHAPFSNRLSPGKKIRKFAGDESGERVRIDYITLSTKALGLFLIATGNCDTWGP
jgi:hypothetical protein